MKESRNGIGKNQPYVKPVEKIELNDKHIKIKTVLAVVFALVAIGCLTYGIMSLLSTEPGWRDVSVNSTLGAEFSFKYNVGVSGVAAGIEYRGVTKVYKEALERAAFCFSNQSYAGIVNLHTMNSTPNVELTIEPELYRAIEIMAKYGRRELYFGPVYEYYNSLFLSMYDNESKNFDPFVNEEVRELFEKIAHFANDNKSINIELLGNNKVILKISDEYLKFADNNDITQFLDFFWMKNAFVIDYLAEKLSESGYKLGIISSYDGFVRNLDDRSETAYSFNIFDRWENTIYPAAVLEYIGENSIIYLRDYQMVDLDVMHYYETESGEIRVPYVDVKDGLSRTRINNIVVYSQDKTCSELLMETIPAYIGDALNENVMEVLTSSGVNYIYGYNGILHTNDSSAKLSDLFDNGSVKYSVAVD